MPQALSVPYAQFGKEALVCDIFTPSVGTPPFPTVLCIHGGGWVSGDRSYMHDVAMSLCDHGFAAVCPQYRFAPVHRYPAAIDDMRACVGFIRDQSELHGFDASRIASLGNSSGGHLAALLGLTCELQGVVDISGVSDLAIPDEQANSISAAFVHEFIGKSFSEAPDLYRDAGPIHHIAPTSPPFLIIHGEADDIVPIQQSLDFARELKRANIDVELHTFPGEGHSFTWSAWNQIESLYLYFLSKTLNHELT